MSTKIYEGYRFPLSKLQDFLNYIYIELEKETEKLAINLMNSVFVESEIEEVMRNKNIENKELAKLWLLFYDKKSEEIRGDIIDLKSSFNLWIQNDLVYMTPYLPNKINIIYPDYVEEYGYWDNDDKPKNITKKEWNNRGKNWNVILDNWDKGRIQHVLYGKQMESLINLKMKIRKSIG